MKIFSFDTLEISCDCVFCAGRNANDGSQVCSFGCFSGCCPFTSIGADESCSSYIKEKIDGSLGSFYTFFIQKAAKENGGSNREND